MKITIELDTNEQSDKIQIKNGLEFVLELFNKLYPEKDQKKEPVVKTSKKIPKKPQKKRGPYLKEKPCVTCGDFFTYKSNKAQFCPNCGKNRQKHYNKKSYQKKIKESKYHSEEKSCPKCGKKFNSNAHYCEKCNKERKKLQKKTSKKSKIEEEKFTNPNAIPEIGKEDDCKLIIENGVVVDVISKKKNEIINKYTNSVDRIKENIVNGVIS